jgi:L-amino acid N-acyltransferase YncA
MFVIREVRPADAEEIVGVFNPIIEAGCYTTFVSPFTVSDERAFIQSFPARGSFLGVFDAQTGQLRGFQVATPVASYTSALDHVGEIGTYVSLGHQRQGVAGHLYRATFEAAKTKGFEKLLAWVRADNEAGLRSYTRYGFERVGVAKRHAKIGERYLDEVIFERWL